MKRDLRLLKLLVLIAIVISLSLIMGPIILDIKAENTQESPNVVNNIDIKTTMTTKQVNNTVNNVVNKNTTTTQKKNVVNNVVNTNKIELTSDVFLLDLSNIVIMESGDIDDTGKLIENKRRIRTRDFSIASHKEYNLKIKEGYTISVYEFDSKYNYIGSNSYTNNTKISLNQNTKYFKAVLKANEKSIEKTLSLGQWSKLLGSDFEASISYGNFDIIKQLNNNIAITSNKFYSASEIQKDLLNDSKNVANKIWNTLVYNKIYTIDSSKLDLNNRVTYYVSPNGDDNNSGLSAKYPKKTLDAFSGVDNINILLECGKTYYMKHGFSVGNNVTIASYGQGDRPVLNYYRNLNKTFTKVADNLYYADLSTLSDIYDGTGSKTDCNIGQLLIDNVVNWKRKVYASSEQFTYELLTETKDDWSWAIDTQNARLYIYTTSNPNNVNIKYAPPVTALSANNKKNITIQGIEIIGSGFHAINFTNCSNVNINSNSFKYIGGSILRTAGTRYGNAVQIWQSAENVSVTNNIANWIFDTCYTTQGVTSNMVLKNIIFENNIGMHSQWGIEIWGASGKEISNIDYSHNLLLNMTDITNPNTKMQCSHSGHLYGEVESSEYISYRYGYTYHQAANLALWFSDGGYLPSIHDNIFWGTNRYLVIGTWNNENIDFKTLSSNLFYEDYSLSRDVIPTMYKIKTSSNKYMTNVSGITSSSNNEVLHKKGTYNNSNELKQMQNLISRIIN